jgi:hypothetical protein
LSRDKKDKDNEDRGNKIKKKNQIKLIFDSNVQEEVIVYVFCLIMVEKDIKIYKRSILFLIYILLSNLHIFLKNN